MRLRRRKRPAWVNPRPKLPFTGTCPVREHTGDGHYVGRCYHATYGGVCRLHGDVSRFLAEGADLADADDRKLP